MTVQRWRMSDGGAAMTVSRVCLSLGIAAVCGGCATGNTNPTNSANPANAANTSPAAGTSVPLAGASGDTLPVGRGSLRQDDISVLLATSAVQVRFIPLDENVLRTLAPDSYRAIHALEGSRAADLASAAQARGLRERNAWYVSFTGLAPDASFSPGDVTITSAGRSFKPITILPLTSQFGSGRVGLRESVGAIYLFDDGLDVRQPLSIDYDVAHSDDWTSVLRRVEREANRIRR